jgi:hypothetical protein
MLPVVQFGDFFPLLHRTFVAELLAGADIFLCRISLRIPCACGRSFPRHNYTGTGTTTPNDFFTIFWVRGRPAVNSVARIALPKKNARKFEESMSIEINVIVLTW